MRTALFLLAGFLLLGAAAIIGRLFSATFPEAMRIATSAFVAIWLAIAIGNLWVGVAKAGYTVTDELPIFLLIFGVPAVAAGLLTWRWL
jgi:hypothetical protein